MVEKMEKTEKKEKIPRQKMAEQPAQVRRRNFNEVPLGYEEDMAVKEAERCLQCKNPGCVQGCPVGVDIPGFINWLKQREFTKSIRHIWKSNSLPAVCGRVCPQESQCEGACICEEARRWPSQPGTLRGSRAHVRESDLPPIAAPSGKKVAAGFGTFGLTVAD
jgi:glutamate synthase (NADPH/NADH) small chain